MSRPTILIADQFSELGGAQRSLLDLLPALAESYTPVVALPGPGPLTAELERLRIRWKPLVLGHYRSGSKSPADMLRYALRQPALVTRLTQLAHVLRAALLYANGPRLFPATAVVARRSDLHLLWHLHLELASARERSLVQAAARLARPAVVACSHACLRPFPRRSLIRRSAEVVYNGVPLVKLPSQQAQRSSAMAPLHRPIIGIIGALHPDKGQLDLLRAAPAVLQAFPEARFRLVGAVADEAYARRLYQRAKTLGARRVEFPGPLPSPTDALAGLDVLAVASHREALGRVILEAFGGGIAVVASDAGGIPEVVEPGANGLLFHRGNADELARTLVQLLGDQSLREKLIRGGRESYQRRWQVERFRAEMLEKITRQIAQRPPRP